ncbi:UNVERIFIED_CONTAM: UDP-glycosyltransferase 73C3 [Sesamum latifolium]|uniref:Glycosyltransferase n=1 Tax=Sesamum latifolium TaxID=2727402 RepID=A0AAW2WE34_9LAMI
MSSIQEQKPHVVMLPFLAQGHIIPMVDLARLLAKRRVTISILTTPVNAGRFQSVIDRAIGTGLDIHVHHLKFPCSEVGLPDGCENFDMLTSADDVIKIFKAIDMLKDQVEESLRQLKPSPNCLIADACFPSWSTNVPLKLNIPRTLFYATNCFSQLCKQILNTCKVLEAVTSDTEYFVMPGFPDRIELTKAQIRGAPNNPSFEWDEFWNEMRAAEEAAFGSVFANTFEELESEYIKIYKKNTGKRAWGVGPVSLCNEDYSDKVERGNNVSVAENDRCLKWLDSKEPGSVVYVCLGSQFTPATSQLIELALGLESSNKPFIWVLKNASEQSEKWLLEEKFEERIKDRGLLIRGWAPQVLILSHQSVGAFLTHCGGNSMLEAIAVGVPMITWPIFADHFCNEKLIVDVSKIGLRLGVEKPVFLEDPDEATVQVKKDQIKRVIEKLTEEGEEANEMRKRAKELGEIAKKAVEEGGSSYGNVTSLIQDAVAEQARLAGHE